VGLMMTVSGVMASDGCLWPATRESRVSTASTPVVPVSIPQRSGPVGAVSMSVERDPTGSPVIKFEAGGVEVRKVVQSDGRFQLQIRTADDHVVLTGDPGLLTFSRRGRTEVVRLNNLQDGAFDRARTLLADSRATRQFRAMAYGLSPSEASSPAGAGLQLTATFLSLLDGDVGAVKRLAGRGTASTGVAPAGTVTATSDEELDGSTCFQRFQGEVVSAWEDFEVCCIRFGFLFPLVDLCAFEWVLRVESAWFQFLGCSSFPVR
jgi:hypothetical protein